MFAISLVAVAMAIYGQAALAAPLDAAAAADENINWVSVEFQGKTLKYNADAFNVSLAKESPLVALARRSNLQSRSASCWTWDDCCGPSTFEGTQPPWASDSDCAGLRDWAYSNHGHWSFSSGGYRALVSYGTCQFQAGTSVIIDVGVGTLDVAELTRDSIGRLANNGLVGAAGDMTCCNSWGCGSPSTAYWRIVHS